MQPVANPSNFRFQYPKLKCMDESRLESESKHVNSFIPNELLIGKKLHPLIALLLFLEKLKSL